MLGLEGESSRTVGVSYHSDEQLPGNAIPCHSPILNLSPNMSPESQPASSSPVFELLDSNRRRTVQGKCLLMRYFGCLRQLV